MNEKIVCPHCGAADINVDAAPRDAAVLLRCPNCLELAVVYHRKAVAVNREIFSLGSHEERLAHIAEVIAQFIDPDMLKAILDDIQTETGPSTKQPIRFADPMDEGPVDKGPISDKEIRHFKKVQLRLLDNPAYYHKYFP